LVWFGIGLDWIGLVCYWFDIGLVWLGLVLVGLDWIGLGGDGSVLKGGLAAVLKGLGGWGGVVLSPPALGDAPLTPPRRPPPAPCPPARCPPPSKETPQNPLNPPPPPHQVRRPHLAARHAADHKHDQPPPARAEGRAAAEAAAGEAPRAAGGVGAGGGGLVGGGRVYGGRGEGRFASSAWLCRGRLASD
jgi:hypothetical protein